MKEMNMSGILQKIGARMERYQYTRAQKRYQQPLSFTEAVQSFPQRNDLYAYMHHYFHHLAPVALREHRAWFKQDQRGFGEDAFHSMWWLLMNEFRPGNCLEIGVYRGQVISLWSLIARELGLAPEIFGISPFMPVNDSVSNYLRNIDYQADTLSSFAKFDLPEPVLTRALSTDTAAAEVIASRQWDMIYIDGSHDYDVVLSDYRLCRDNLASGGILVMDDSGLDSDYEPPAFSFKGHPGPSEVASKFAMQELQFLGAVGHNTLFQKP